MPQKSVWIAGLKDRSTIRKSLTYKCHPWGDCQTLPCIQPLGGERQTAQEMGVLEELGWCRIGQGYYK